jgi:hypothetical protein
MIAATIKLTLLLLILVPNNNYGLKETKKHIYTISKQFNNHEHKSII